jgi:hypothetical protein
MTGLPVGDPTAYLVNADVKIFTNEPSPGIVHLYSLSGRQARQMSVSHNQAATCTLMILYDKSG